MEEICEELALIKVPAAFLFFFFNPNDVAKFGQVIDKHLGW